MGHMKSAPGPSGPFGLFVPSGATMGRVMAGMRSAQFFFLGDSNGERSEPARVVGVRA